MKSVLATLLCAAVFSTAGRSDGDLYYYNRQMADFMPGISDHSVKLISGQVEEVSSGADSDSRLVRQKRAAELLCARGSRGLQHT